MSKLFYLATTIIVLAITYGFLSMGEVVDPNSEYSPYISGNPADTTPPAGFPYPTAFNFNYATIANMNAGTVGALRLDGRYYFNRWNSTDTYIYDASGPNGAPGVMLSTKPYTGSVRDLTHDGRYLYGGKASTILYKMDTNMTLMTQFTLGAPNIRAVAWDPNRKGFWHCDFAGNIVCHDSLGGVKGTIVSTLAGKYGLAFDSTSSSDSAFVWAWNQGTGSLTNELVKYHAQSGVIKATYIFNLPGASIGIAGGAELDIYGSEVRLLLNYQNFAMNGYTLKTLVGIAGNNNNVPDQFSLKQNYPNPFNPATTINFVLPKASNVTLKVFDVNGKEVATLLNDFVQAGTHSYDFNAGNLASGVYLYRMTAGEFTDTRKMLLVK